MQLRFQRKLIICAALYAAAVFVISVAVGVMMVHQVAPQPTLMTLGHDLYRRGNLEEAAVQYEQLLTHHPDNTELLSAATLTAIELGHLSQALTYSERLVNLDPSASHLAQFGRIQLLSGRYEAAIASLTQALEVSHGQEQGLILHDLGRAYAQQGRLTAALEALASGLAQLPTATLIHNTVASLYEQKGEVQLALQALETSLQLDRSQYHLNLRLAKLAQTTGEYGRAVSYLQTVNRIRPSQDLEQRITELWRTLPPRQPEPPSPGPIAPRQVEHAQVVPGPESPIIRVRLLQAASYFTCSFGSDIQLIESSGQTRMLSGEHVWKVSASGDTVLLASDTDQITASPPVRLRPTLDNTTFALYNVEYGSGYFFQGQETRQYRGELEIRMSNNELTAINHLPLEAYLFSVVPGEIIASWPEEALKAQAIASRTYTLFRLGRQEASGYDLSSSISDHNYPGIGWEHPRTTAAVSATAGMYLTHNGQAIDAVYSANSGGLQASSEEIWGGMRPYLEMGVEGEQSPLDSPTSFWSFLRAAPDVFSNYGSPQSNFRWTRTYNRDELEWLAPSQIGTLIDVRILGRGPSGRVAGIEWIGSEDRTVVTGDRLRSALGGLRSNLFLMEPIYQDGTIQSVTLFGGGWGHGVGMSQAGAAGMAAAGFTAEEILRKYYANTEIAYLATIRRDLP